MTAPDDAERIRQLRHDLRTPINHIVGYAELVMDDAADRGETALAEALAAVHADAEAALVLIDRITGAEVMLEHGPALAALARGMIARLEPLQQHAATEQRDDLDKIAGAARTLLALTGVLPAPAAIVGMAAGVAGETKPGALLVVDDNEMNRDMLTRRLGRLGYSVECAENGRQALERLETDGIDLMLLDVMMPEMDGYAVLERRRADPRLREIPVIMLSALSEVESIVRCIELGAEDYLPKPFNPVLLRARIEACIDRKHRRDAEVAYLRDVTSLTEAAAAVEAGTFEPAALDPIAARPDELGQLTRVFQRMARGVAEREAQLQERVQRLQYVFLSYASADRQRALLIVQQLESAGIRVWVDHQGIAGGSNYGLEIVHGIRDCAVMLVACTDASMGSRNVKQEIQLAWKYGRPYVPLLLSPVSIPEEIEYWLEGWQWVELLERPAESWLPELLAALGRHGVQPLSRDDAEPSAGAETR